ncbi:transketolase [Pandoraea communis]|uniref:Transketolase n=1 Tax=Pandoraea communis TaxID=2508297 RepID=A0A5E4T3D0_9BURK|nr:transketolase C-terminal domain-containing protein [Pandoraea communis]VVD82315.1 transketolase [Pandoraea communis]
MRAAFSDALVSAALANPKILLLTGDHGYALFDAFRRACPNQYINCGVAEQNMVGVAAGLARAGFRPVVYGLAAFVPVRVLEQIKIDICYENLPVMLIGDGAGFVYSHLGASHQSMEDVAVTRPLPGLTILSPADRYEMAATMQLAFDTRGPVYLRMGKSDRGDVHNGALTLTPGTSLKVRERNREIVLIATGSMVSAAVNLVDAGMQADVWSIPSIKPLDTTALRGIGARAKDIFVLEEHVVAGGLGSCVAESLADLGADTPRVHRIGVEDRFSAYCGTYEYLLSEHRLDTPTIRKRIEGILSSSGGVAT